MLQHAAATDTHTATKRSQCGVHVLTLVLERSPSSVEFSG